MSSYPIGDLISGIKNGYKAGLSTVVMPYSSFKNSVAGLLREEGFLEAVKTENREGKKNLILTLKYEDRQPKITDIKLISKPGLRRYVRAKDLKKILGGLGIQIISTPQGVLSNKTAKKKGVGGEVICEVW
ncbi:MAG: 30S ribosomal protein S8 [Patescibacteria group bacterium]|nr:30S ribosomal protein S8 [Patescibacteria group bacterium]